jgi:Arc/MetJ-type ribon-helix-helix transcriptional regulator
MSDKRFTAVSIPTPLFEKIKERIDGTDFTSVSSYVVHVLREVLAATPETTRAEGESLSKEDEEKVRERLKALGYLD